MKIHPAMASAILANWCEVLLLNVFVKERDRFGPKLRLEPRRDCLQGEDQDRDEFQHEVSLQSMNFGQIPARKTVDN